MCLPPVDSLDQFKVLGSLCRTLDFADFASQVLPAAPKTSAASQLQWAQVLVNLQVLFVCSS